MASASRTKRLADLGLHYGDDGIWVFDVDQFKHPRKKADLLETSQPAIVTGYLPWPHENGVALRKVVGVEERKKLKREKGILLPELQFRADFSSIYKSLQNQYDERYEKAGLFIQYPAMHMSHSLPLDATHGLTPQFGMRIERQYDGVPMWDGSEQMQIDLFNSQNRRHYTAYGVASLVHNDEELLKVTGSDPSDSGAEIERISISLRYADSVDVTERVVQGIYKDRYTDYDAGLFGSRGEQWAQNKKVLVGTALEGQPWDVVLEYLHGKRTSPLW